jgi:hypothetical protein
MNRRLPIYLILIVVLLGLAGLRYGCRGGPAVVQGDSVDARLAEIHAIRQGKDPADTEQLLDLSRHQDQRVSRAAIYALASFEGSAPKESLHEVLRNGPTPDARAAAAIALGQREDNPRTLIAVLSSERDPQVRAGAAQGLAHYCNPDRRDALPALMKGLRDPDPEVRAWAIRAIHKVSIKRFLYEPDKDPREQQDRIAYIEQRLRQLNLMR